MTMLSSAQSRALAAAVALLAALAQPVYAAPGAVDLAVAMVGAPDPVVPGKLLTYRISVNVRGDRQASNVSLQTAVPAGAVFRKADGPPEWSISAPAVGGVGNVSATIASAPPGRTFLFQVTVLVEADTPVDTAIANTVTVASSTTDPTPSDNTAATSTTVRAARPPLADLGTAIELLQEPAATAGSLVSMVLVKNDGPQTATDVVIRTATPEGTTFGWAAATAGALTTPEVGATGNIECTLDAIPSGKEVAITVVTTVVALAGARLETMSLVTAGSTDPELRNNVARETALVVPQGASTDLSVAIADLPDTVRMDSDVTYRVVAANDGPGDVELLTVFTPIPAGARFISATPDRGTVRLPPPGKFGAIGWRPGGLAAGETTSLSVTVRVSARSGVPFNVGALLASLAADTDTSNNLVADSARVQTIGLATLQWTPPDLSSGGTTPPPTDVVVDPTPDAPRPAASKTSAPRDEAEAPIEYNVYVSSTPNVPTSPQNLWTTVPANETTTTVPVAPGGSFFTVTATYPDGESATSGEDGTGDQPGATLTSVKVKSAKITGKGTGFTDVVEMYLDGIPFADAATVKGSNSKAIQKGSLAIGMTVEQYTAAGGAYLIIFRNSDGGVTIWEYEP